MSEEVGSTLGGSFERITGLDAAVVIMEVASYH